MCLQFVVATSEPIDTPYDPEVGEVGSIRRLPERTAGDFRAFTKPHLHAIHFEHRCGCWCRRPDSPLRPALVSLLEWALRSAPEVELYACNPGRERSEPTLRDWCTPTELLYLRQFEGGELLTIPRDAELSAAGSSAHDIALHNS